MTDEVLQEILDEVLTATPPRTRAPVAQSAARQLTPVIGTLVGFREDPRAPLVAFTGQSTPVAARTLIALDAVNLNAAVVLVFERGDVTQPIILGCLQSSARASDTTHVDAVEINADGERLVVTARQQVVLRCGNASITLNKDGKIVVKGTSVVTHADGVNRIRGGSVQIN
jgi:hypothetical protein